MQLDSLIWLFLPVFVAGGSALLSFYIMQARMEVALAKERESLAEARAIINSQKATMEERIKATQEAARRAALDELMGDLRVEERSYVRENRALARKAMVMQERVFFRNIPLSTWSETEMVVEDGAPALPEPTTQTKIELAPPVPMPEPRLPISKRIDPGHRPQGAREPRTLVPMHAAFGAQ